MLFAAFHISRAIKKGGKHIAALVRQATSWASHFSGDVVREEVELLVA